MAMLPSSMMGATGGMRNNLAPVNRTAPTAPTAAPGVAPSTVMNGVQQRTQIQPQPVTGQTVAQTAGAPAAGAATGINPAYLGKPPTAGVSTLPSAPQSNVDLSGSSFAQSIMNALAPQFKQQQLGLNEQLANSGIVGGSALNAQSGLGLQQQAQAQGDLQPILAQLKGYALSQSQGNQLAGENVGEFNSSQTNATNQFNVDNAIKSAMTDTGSFNTILSQLLGFQNQDWLGQLSAQSSLNSGAQAGQTSAFQPIWQQPASGSSDFSGLGTLYNQPTPTINGYMPGSPQGVASLGGAPLATP